MTIKFLGSRGRGLVKGKYLRVKDSLYVGRDKTIALVEAGGRFYLVGVANQAIQLLGTIEQDELSLLQSEEGSGGGNMKSSVSKLMSSVKKFTNAPEELRKAQAVSKEEVRKEAVSKEAVSKEAVRKEAVRKEAKEDEIDRMMQSIQERKGRLRKKDDGEEM